MKLEAKYYRYNSEVVVKFCNFASASGASEQRRDRRSSDRIVFETEMERVERCLKI